jgi:GntR family transcriptional regulator, transcriptional repressor for pyruvate dehydrogenase complex
MAADAAVAAVFEPVQTATTFEETVDRLGTAIRLGILAPGSRLPSERELAEQLGVSRSTVREAVQFLGALGLVEIRHGSGTFVRSDGDLPSEWLQWTRRHQVEVHELLEVRRGLEAVAAELAAERSHDLEAMEAALADMEAAIHGPDVPGLVEADLSFHTALAAASGNTALRHLTESLGRELLRERGAIWNEPGRPDRSLREHRRIFESVRAGDALGARTALVDHLHSVEQDVDVLVGQPADEPNRKTKAR